MLLLWTKTIKLLNKLKTIELFSVIEIKLKYFFYKKKKNLSSTIIKIRNELIKWIKNINVLNKYDKKGQKFTKTENIKIKANSKYE